MSHIVYLGAENVSCRYHKTGDCYEWTRNGITYRRPCTGINCFKHSCVKRHEYAEGMEDIMRHYRNRFFVTLPVGRVLTTQEFEKFWRCFRDGLRYRYPDIEYFFMKEIQHMPEIDLAGGEVPLDMFHLHGVVVSDTHTEIDDIAAIFNKYLAKCCNIHRNVSGDEVSVVDSDVGVAKYVAKDMKRPPRVVIPTSGVIKRWALPSAGFWEAPGASQSLQVPSQGT